jgi:hypothetical protein
MAINNSKRIGVNLRRKKAENLRRRKETLFKKVYELGKYDGVDVALILRQNGRFFTYRSIDLESWPLSMKEIIRLCYPFIYLPILSSKQQVSYPIPKNILPQDIERRLQSSADQNSLCITDRE